MEKQTVYINNPVSEKEGNEPLLVLHLLPNVQAAINMKITHYLEPVEGYFMTEDELRGILRKAFNAGSNFEFYGNSQPDEKSFINSIIN